MSEDFERVVAVEMDERNAECTRANAPKAEVINAALDCEQDKKVYYSPDEFERSPIYKVDASGGNVVRSITIDALHLSPDFIKLDLQGYDSMALMGAEETLKRSKPTLFFEHVPKCYKRYGLDGTEIIDYLSDLGAREIMVLGPDRLWGWP